MIPETPFHRRLQWTRILIPVGISLVTLIGLSLVIDGKGLSQVLHQADPVLVGLAALKTPLLVLLWSLRWHLLVRTRQLPVRFHQTVVTVLIRSFFNNLTPGAGTGGEPAGAYYLAKRTPLTFKEAIAGMAAERMVQGVAMAGLILIALGVCVSWLPLSSTLIRSLILGLIGFMGFVGLMFYLSLFQFQYGRAIIEGFVRVLGWAIPAIRSRVAVDRLRPQLDSFHQEYRAFLHDPATILGIVLCTALAWGLDLVQPYLLFRALHVEVPFWLVVVSTMTIKIVGIFSLIPGGAGLVEGLNFGLYSGLSNVPHQVIVAETILFRALDSWLLWLGSGIVTSVVGAVLMARSAPRPDRQLSLCAVSEDCRLAQAPFKNG